ILYKHRNGFTARMKLEGIFEEGLKPASSLKEDGKDNVVALSEDDSIANVVAVNVFPFSQDAKKNAEFAVTTRAGGAISIAIEQKGDNGVINLSILEQRAVDSAVLIIDPDKLNLELQRQVQEAQEARKASGGEWGLSGVNPGAIVAVL